MPFASIAVGDGHACGLTADGAAHCWGANEHGQLGTGTTTGSDTPLPVAGGLRFARLDGATGHTCGITLEGEAYCWGDNRFSQIGDGTSTDRLTPTRVATTLRFREIAVSTMIVPEMPTGGTSCGLATDGGIYCWGFNGGGLARCAQMSCPLPVRVAPARQFVSVDIGRFFACGIVTTGETLCWGDVGVLASAPRDPVETNFVIVSNGVRFTSIQVGERHACGLTAAGAAYCMADNSSGELGDGTHISRAVPVAVAGGHTFRRISALRGASCGIDTEGVTWCWGWGLSTGIGTPNGNVNVPTLLPRMI
jgi:alpha-tubulin suppressor-like RCC1 family protein